MNIKESEAQSFVLEKTYFEIYLVWNSTWRTMSYWSAFDLVPVQQYKRSSPVVKKHARLKGP